MRVVLASGSPRRRDLLRAHGIAFTLAPPDIDESRRAGEAPDEYVCRLARAKAQTAAPEHPVQIVLGADTVVALGTQLFGKPRDLADAQRMLAALSGKTHHVLTGVCLCRRAPVLEEIWLARTEVTFRDLSPDDILAYCRLVDPCDKAGAYAIQEHGDMLVESVTGLRSNVVGLPVEEVVRKLRLIARADERPLGPVLS